MVQVGVCMEALMVPFPRLKFLKVQVGVCMVALMVPIRPCGFVVLMFW